jgi:hypothetical protein
MMRVAGHRPNPKPFLGIAIDPARDGTTDADLSGIGASVRTFVITTRESLEIAAAVRTSLDAWYIATRCSHRGHQRHRH